jgi:predicted transcriptional regulator
VKDISNLINEVHGNSVSYKFLTKELKISRDLEVFFNNLVTDLEGENHIAKHHIENKVITENSIIDRIVNKIEKIEGNVAEGLDTLIHHKLPDLFDKIKAESEEIITETTDTVKKGYEYLHDKLSKLIDKDIVPESQDILVDREYYQENQEL